MNEEKFLKQIYMVQFINLIFLLKFEIIKKFLNDITPLYKYFKRLKQ